MKSKVYVKTTTKWSDGRYDLTKLEYRITIHLDVVMEYIQLKVHVIHFISIDFVVESYGINKDNYLGGSFKNQVKKIVVDTAKEWPTYFAKLFPVAVSRKILLCFRYSRIYIIP